jgi:membrane protein implicated in regulation of membrane protease activity
VTDILSSPSLLWFVFGFALLLVELAAPGFIILFFGLGAWAAALCVWLFGVSLSWQIAVFLGSSVLFILLLRRLFVRVFTGASAGEEEADMNDAPANVGQRAEVIRAVAPGAPGEIKYRGSYWRAVADEPFETGATVRIVEEFEDDKSTYKIGPYGA